MIEMNQVFLSETVKKNDGTLVISNPSAGYKECSMEIQSVDSKGSYT